MGANVLENIHTYTHTERMKPLNLGIIQTSNCVQLRKKTFIIFRDYMSEKSDVNLLFQ